MLVACRLAGLSALEADYAGVNARAFMAAWASFVSGETGDNVVRLKRGVA